MCETLGAGMGVQLEPSISVSSSHYDFIYEGLQRAECKMPKNRRSIRTRLNSSRSGEKCGENIGKGRQLCSCAASFAGDCAAVCCCPCAFLHLFILAIVAVPCVLTRRVFCYVKKKGRSSNRKLQHFNKTNGDDEKGGKCRYCSPPWSVTQSPCTSEVLADGSLSAKLDTHNIWWELYAAGHMGFGGIPFERD
uniref:TB510 n=1 Tax=Taxus baccata TaxID=25629 RepID=A0A0A0S6N9_TAXBA|nr:TB510 [Taxus baccata]